MPAHSHRVIAGFYTYVGSGGENVISNGSSVNYSDRANVGAGRYGETTTKGSGAAHPIMNPYIIINYEVVCA